MQLATPHSSQLPLTGRKLTSQFSHTSLVEQLMQLVRLHDTHRLALAEGTKPMSQASQMFSELHWRQLVTLQEKQVLLVLLRVKPWAQVTQVLVSLSFLQMSQLVISSLQG